MPRHHRVVVARRDLLSGRSDVSVRGRTGSGPVNSAACSFRIFDRGHAVRIFLSYRRDDSAAHAGRLYDGLVARFGARNVFQDVTAIEPGADFVMRLEEALASADAALVLIGPRWLDAAGPDGSRRLDEPDDYVRREVAAALGAGRRVVPVLVGGAAMPAPAELPDDLRGLAQRQGVVLSDASWREDVAALVRRLEGEQTVEDRRRRWPVALAALVAVAGVGVAAWLVLRDNEPAVETTGTAVPTSEANGELPACVRPDDSWEQIEVVAGESVTLEGEPTLTVTLAGASYLQTDDGWLVVVETAMHNDDSVDSPYEGVHEHGYWFYESLVIDGLPQGDKSCFSIVAGDLVVKPGQRDLAHVGFLIADDPQGSPMLLQLGGQRGMQVSAAV